MKKVNINLLKLWLAFTLCTPFGLSVHILADTVIPGAAPTLTTGDPACSQALFSSMSDVSVGTQPYSVAIGDFNGDGKQDLAAANYNSNTVSIRLGNGLGGFSVTTDVAVGTNPRPLAIGDFNGDGKQDIAVPNEGSNTVSIRLGNGLGGFIGTTNVAVGTRPLSVAIGDFNGDGKQDLAVANYSSNTVSIHLGDGLGGFTGSTNVAVGTHPYSVATGDFNGDGNPDFAVAHQGSPTVFIRLGDGSGGFFGTTSVSVGAEPISVAIGDFNRDGNPDFAVANNLSNTVSIRLGDGSGGFFGTTDLAVGTRPTSVAIGDFNGDGNPDFAATNQASATVSIRLGDGAGSFSGTTNVSVGTTSISVAIGDFNGDGNQDFATANRLPNTVSIRLGVKNEINVQGNSMSILDGDNTPSMADYTDFGSTTGAPISRTFTIQNTGNVALSLATGAITLTGANANLFSVSNIVLPATLSGPSGSITFDVTYTPVGVGTHTANVVITSDDCDEATYDFAIRGELTCTTPTFTGCPSTPVTANTAMGFCNAAMNYSVMVNGTPDPTLIYAFTGATTGSGNGTGSGSSFNKGNTTVTLTATNICGAPTCVITVTVVDNENPTIVCRQASVQLQGTQYTLTPADVLNFAASSDNCGQIQVTNISPAQVGCDQIGQTIQVQVTATDGNGNNATCMASTLINKDSALPPGWTAANIGTTATGNSSYDYCKNPGEFILSANGYTTNTIDVQHSVYQTLCGDGDIIARVASISTQGGWAGIQMRESASQGAKKFTIKTQLNTNNRREARTATNGPTNNLQIQRPFTYNWLRITRSGNVFAAYLSVDGVNWGQPVSSTTMTMNSCIQVGLFVESINNTTTTQATFANVNIGGGVSPLTVSPDTPTAVAVYPNPTTGEVNIDLTAYAGRAVRLEIYNLQGQLLHFAEIPEVQTTERLDLSAFPSGMYLVKVKSEGLPDVSKRLVVNSEQ